MSDKPVWTYWVSRDSLDGILDAKCNVWRIKPIRVQHRYRVTWVCADHLDPGHLGEFPPDEVGKWFRVYPETDRELICVETYPSQAELDKALREQQSQ